MYVILGIGNFGYYVAKTLYEAGEEVLAVDQSRERVQNADKICTKAVVADVTDRDTLKSLDVDEARAVIIALGDDMAASILATLHLKDLGARRIIVKAISEEHARILAMIGAHEVIFPERDMALKVARQIISPNMLDSLYLSEQYSMWEIAPPSGWIGKTLSQIKVRNEYNIQVVAIKDALEDAMHIPPPSDYVIKDSDILIVIGRNRDLEKLKRLEG